MLAGETLLFAGVHFLGTVGTFLLPPLVIVIWAIVLMSGNKSRTGKGMLLGLLSIIAVLLLLVAACFGLLSNANFAGMH